MQAWLGSVMRSSVRYGMAGGVWHCGARCCDERQGKDRQAWPIDIRRLVRCPRKGAFQFPATGRRVQSAKKQRNKTMSKKMSCAYWALRMKDAAMYYASVAMKAAIALFAFALMVVRTTAFTTALAVALCAAVVCGILYLVAFLCNRRMSNLGFTEIELERWGLA